MHKESKCAIIIEGELNALSLELAFPETTILSTGSLGSARERLIRYIKANLPPETQFTIIADKDVAGTTAAIKLADLMLVEDVKLNKIQLWERDANQILVANGKEEIFRQAVDQGFQPG